MDLNAQKKIILFGGSRVILKFSVAAIIAAFAFPVAGAEPDNPAAIEKSDAEKTFDTLFEKYLATLKKKVDESGKTPVSGRKVEFKLTNGVVVSGNLAELSDGSVSIKEQHGVTSYPVNRIDKKYWLFLFPKSAAKILAIKEMTEQCRQVKPDKLEVVQAQGHTFKQPAGGQQTPEAPVNPAAAEDISDSTPSSTPQSSGSMKYDPTVAATPDELEKPLKAFGQWLSYRANGMADKVYAKRQDNCAVAYVKVGSNYRKLDYDSRFSITEGMWNMWGFRCLDHKATRSLNKVHLVVLDQNNKIIGGSTPDDSSNIWVEKKL